MEHIYETLTTYTKIDPKCIVQDNIFSNVYKKPCLFDTLLHDQINSVIYGFEGSLPGVCVRYEKGNLFSGSCRRFRTCMSGVYAHFGSKNINGIQIVVKYIFGKLQFKKNIAVLICHTILYWKIV